MSKKFSVLIIIAVSALSLTDIAHAGILGEAKSWFTGEAIEDQHITRAELANIVKEGRNIFAVWK